jgi:hypothetical protein
VAAPVKLTVSEGVALAMELADVVGYNQLLTVLTATLGVQRALALAEDHTGRISKSETVALIKAVLPLVPGDTLKAKIKFAISALRRAIPDKTRQDAILAYVVEKIKEYKYGQESPPTASSAYQTTGTVCGYGPVNNHWKLPDHIVDQILNRMQLKNVRAYKVESVGHANEDVLGTPSKLEQMKRATLYAADGCAKRGIYYHVTIFNDNAGKSNWRNDGPALSKRLPQAKAFIDWFAATVSPKGVFVVIVGETRTNAGKELEKYGAKKLKAAGFIIGNNQGSRPQSTAVFGGIKMDFYEYHPTAISDWPKSNSAHVTSDTGAILARLNAGGNVYGLGNPPVVAGWRAVAEAQGFPFVIYYGFNVAEYDEGTIDAMSPEGTVDAPAGQASNDDVDLSAAKWHGPNGAGARVTARLDGLNFDGKNFTYKQSGTSGWKKWKDGSKTLNSYACFFVKRNGQWAGGKFDGCSEDRNWRDIKNIIKGYTGGIRPKAGEEVRICLINQSGSERTNAPGVIWK